MLEGIILSSLSVVLLVISASIMKWISYRDTHTKVPHEFLFLPILSVRTWRRARPATNHDVWSVGSSFVLCWIFIFLLWPTWRYFIGIHDILLINYSAIIPLILAVYTFESTLRFASILGTGKRLPPLLSEPWKSKSLAEFWGHRWNTWVNDWMEEIFLKKRFRMTNAVWAFAFSGIWHEYFMWLPTYVLSDLQCKSDKGLPGLLLGYFLIQFIGTAIDRGISRANKFRRIWCWVVVIGPIPLFLNDSTLKIFLLK